MLKADNYVGGEYMRYALFVLAIACLSTTVNAGGLQTHGKPRVPLYVNISPVQTGLVPADIKPGDAVEFRITGKAFADADKLNIDVELHGGVTPVSGETFWSGPAKNGIDKVMLITVRPSAKGDGMIRVRISMSPSNGAFFSTETEYRLGKSSEKKPAVLPPKKKDRKGREIREYQVN